MEAQPYGESENPSESKHLDASELADQMLLFQPIAKHPDTFYSAIYEKASYFGMEPLDFAALIK